MHKILMQWQQSAAGETKYFKVAMLDRINGL